MILPQKPLQYPKNVVSLPREINSKKSHRGDTVAKIWIEKNGEKNIEIAWSELTADEEAEILKAIDDNWEELNKLIDQVFDGKKIHIKRIK